MRSLKGEDNPFTSFMYQVCRVPSCTNLLGLPKAGIRSIHACSLCRNISQHRDLQHYTADTDLPFIVTQKLSPKRIILCQNQIQKEKHPHLLKL